MIVGSSGQGKACTASRRPGSGRPRGTIEREDRCVWRMAVVHRTASAAEIRAAVDTTVTQQTITNRVSTSCLGLLDHQIFLHSSTYGTSLDDNSSIIHNQHSTSLYLTSKCNRHGTPSHKLTSDTCTTQCMHVCIQNSGG
ncbi:hypothetical protein AVEN_237983-1 [Araneus ventricosus]|uniref:Transposase Tc1-like domain-containing protein n=1 Tax=Araneus ventricosus TaxID=182803 RepID=A0A4Y2G1R9_ARAVE|nr:hypothetical protein AVEN_237983-1 [Araneus ventricosus]